MPNQNLIRSSLFPAALGISAFAAAAAAYTLSNSNPTSDGLDWEYNNGVPQWHPHTKKKVLLALGDSTTRNNLFGVEHQYPALLQAKLNELGAHLKKPWMVVDAGFHGNTSGEGFNRLEKIVESNPKKPANAIICSLGTNDFLKNIPFEQLQQNLQNTIDLAKKWNPEAPIVIGGMIFSQDLEDEILRKERLFKLFCKRPLTSEAIREWGQVYESVHQNNPGTTLIRCVVGSVFGRKDLVCEDRIHPNKNGCELVRDGFYDALHPILQGLEQRKGLSFAIRSTAMQKSPASIQNALTPS